MENKPISVGDLVQVVRHSTFAKCCPDKGGQLGRIFVVGILRPPASGYMRCVHCDRRYPFDGLVAKASAQDLAFELGRLKRIPPLDELEGVDEREPIYAAD